MNNNIVHQVQQWFGENKGSLSALFEKVNLNTHGPDDPERGQIAIQLDGPHLGATLSFWNKGDVMAIGIDKVRRQEFSFDDRVMDPADDVKLLLESYLGRLKQLRGMG